MNHAPIIDALGGYIAVARDLNVPKTTVHTWRRRGIPARKWPELLALPGAKTAAIDANALLNPDDYTRPDAPAPEPAQ